MAVTAVVITTATAAATTAVTTAVFTSYSPPIMVFNYKYYDYCTTIAFNSTLASLLLPCLHATNSYYNYKHN